MANKLVFPIEFDIEGGAKNAEKKAKEFTARLHRIVNDPPAVINVDISSIKDLRGKLSVFKNTWYRTTNSIEEQMRRLEERWRNMKPYEKFDDLFGHNNRLTPEAKEILNTYRQLSAALDSSHKSLRQVATEQEKTANSTKKANQSFREQTTYVERLIQRLAVYTSLGAITGFLNKVREVTAQMELQRISLGAIIQDQERANQILNEIKNFAVQSPVKLFDLTKYTKQLAAYRIETDKLFDTTKRLADVSVGLGVDMERLIMAYGKTKSTAVLNAVELRQFGMMGIPMLELVAQKMSELQGKTVSTSEAFEMIKKRMVGFDVVEQIFEDMTNKGGIFYDMQIKQGNTLYGMWQKLGDAATIMYDEIGNTKWVNEGMKSAISLLRSMMLNWQRTGVVLGGVVGVLGLYISYTKSQRLAQQMLTTAHIQYVTTLKAEIASATAANAAATRNIALSKNGTIWTKLLAQAHLFQSKCAIIAANANYKAAISTSALSKAFYKLQAALAANPFGVILVALAAFVGWIATAKDELAELQSKLSEIDTTYADKSREMKNNFKELADTAVNSIDGSKKQKEALDELNRTYGQILGTENLQIDKLKELGGAYDELNDIIESYNIKRKGEEKETAIKDVYGEALRKAEDDIKDFFKAADYADTSVQKALSDFKQDLADGVDAAEAFNNNISALWKRGNLQVGRAFGNLFNPFGGNMGAAWSSVFGGQNVATAFQKYVDLIYAQNKALEDNRRETTDAANALDGYTKEVQNMQAAISQLDWSSFDALSDTLKKYNAQHPENAISLPVTLSFKPEQAKNEVDRATEQANMQLQAMYQIMEKKVAEYGKKLPETFYTEMQSVVDGNKDFSIMNFDALEQELAKWPQDMQKTLRPMFKQFQQIYQQLVPSDEIVRISQRRLRQIVNNAGLEMDNFKRFLMQNGENLEEHRKKIKDEIDALNKTLKGLLYAKKFLILFGLPTDATEAAITEAEQQIAALEKYLSEIPDFDKKKGGKGRGRQQQDTRLQNLQEIAQTLEKINKEYGEMIKLESKDSATERLKKDWQTTLDFTNKLANSIKLPKGVKLPTFDFPTTFKQLQEYRREILKAMQSIKVKGGDKAVLEFETMISKADFDEAQRQIEANLKRLQERISQTKTAREFYDKILSATGDADIATDITVSVYGNVGDDLFDNTVKQIKEVFKSGDINVSIPIEEAIDTKNQRINYAKLAELYNKYQDSIIEKNRDTANKIIEEGKKTAAQDVLNWQKMYEKAKSYEEQISDVIRRESAERDKIIKSNLSQEQKDRFISLSYDKQAKDISKISVDEFKNSEDFIRVFQDLDKVSGETLDRMQKRLQEMIETVKGTENVEGLKALVDALEKIKNEKVIRNPFDAVISGFKEWRKAHKDYREAQANEAKVKAEYAEQEAALNLEIESAMREQVAAQKSVNQHIAEGTEETDEGVAAQVRLNSANTILEESKKRQENAVKKVKKAEQDTTDALDAQIAAVKKIQNGVNAIANSFNGAAGIIQTIADTFGIVEDSDAGDVVKGLVQGLQTAATVMTTIMTILVAIEILGTSISATMWWVAAIGAAVGALTALFTWISNSKVRKANKEIERQQSIIDSLTYSYSRLEKAMEKALGGSYISNFQQQLSNLQRQQAAYQKQYDAEMSKGKKTDKDKLKDYADAARDVADQIADMRDELVNWLAGTDITSAARDFASSWIDAYVSFDNTTEAMRAKFQDMIKNMIIESMAAKLMENLLRPVYEAIDKATDKGYVNEQDIANVADLAFGTIEQMNSSMMLLMESLKAKGLDVLDVLKDTDAEDNLSGIVREIANASEESVTGLAAGINTQNYYMSYVPQIATDVAAIRAYVVGDPSLAATNGVNVIDLVTMQNTYLQHLPTIAANTAATVERCERAALACEDMAMQLGRVIKARGTTATHTLSVALT